MKQFNPPVFIENALQVAALSQRQSPLRSVSIDIHNADKYANQLAEIYNGSVHTALMKHDPKVAVRIATLFAELCSSTGRADIRIASLSNQLTQGEGI